MQDFRADLHIHSRFSRATSTKLSLGLLASWASIKGIDVLGTGDFTHPAWRAEMRENLVLDEPSGLYTLARPVDAKIAMPSLCLPKESEKPVRFMIQGEISSIYKRGGKVRKVHNLVFLPDFDTADAFCQRLEQIGNLNADGRPILGLDSHDLLEMVLEANKDAFLIPAHIWTPWFSVFGSKSGFDDMRDCFGDLTSHIFALETGLSSDPAMNRLWSALDGFRLISNSDAHSGENLGREANIFSGEISYKGILNALRETENAGTTTFKGTLEFFPEEGKYHTDGHRKCHVNLTPAETKELNGICPVCGQPVTVGVLHRVVELADRDTPVYPDGKEAQTIVPLREVLGELLGVGGKSKKVTEMYAKVLERFGSELHVLQTEQEDELARFYPPLGESIGRMRRGDVHISSGYDGEYGIIRMFSDEERKDLQLGAGIAKKSGGKGKVQSLSLLEGQLLQQEIKTRKKIAAAKDKEAFQAPSFSPKSATKSTEEKNTEQQSPSIPESDEANMNFIFSASDDPEAKKGILSSPESANVKNTALHDEEGTPISQTLPGCGTALNEAQKKAAYAGPGPVLVIAGPGTGKTKTLVARIEGLLEEGITPRHILAVTFTRKAAAEMDQRLAETLPGGSVLPRTDTLHALALELWLKVHGEVPVLLSEESAQRVFAEANPECTALVIKDGWNAVSLAREKLQPLPEIYAEMAQNYTAHKSAWNLSDYTDLLEFWLERTRSGLNKQLWSHVLVDEIQDLSPLQLELVRTLLPESGEGFFGIGDPDQSIYGFRGASGKSLEFFQAIWPTLQVIQLEYNYRSRQEILATAIAVQAGTGTCKGLRATNTKKGYLHLFHAPSSDSEAKWIADRVMSLLGSTSHTLLDAIVPLNMQIPESGYAPGDIAILVRTHSLGREIRKALSRVGVPVSAPQVDAFWQDARVALILRGVGRMFGIDLAVSENEDEVPSCPETILAKGPLGLAAYLSTVRPFDEHFWHTRTFRSLVKAYDANGGWAGLITWINMQTELELIKAKAQKVQILSLHAAKGLEFPVVFLPCLEDGLLPFAGPGLLSGRLSKNDGPDVEEERRLFYVGLTRAKDALFLSCAEKRFLFGHEIRLKPSRFLSALPKDSITESTIVAKNLLSEKQLRLF